MTSERFAPRSSYSAIAVVLGVAALFGTTGTALAQAPPETDALAAGSVRLLVGGFGLCLVARRHLRTAVNHWMTMTVGAVGVAVYQLGFFDATRRTGVAMATVVTIAVSPLASRIIGAFRGRPAPSALWYVAGAMIAAGLTLLVGFGSDGVKANTAGIAAAALAGVSYAVYTEAGSTAIARGLDSTTSMAALFLGGGVLSSPVLLFRDVSWLGTSRGIAVIAWLAIITLTLAYIGFGWGLRVLAPTTVVMLTLLEPVVASVLAVTVLDESLATVGWVGAALIVVAMPLVGLSTRTTVRA